MAVQHLFIDRLTMLRMTANADVYGGDGLFDIMFCRKDGTICELKQVGRFIKNGQPKKTVGTRLGTNYNKTETILVHEKDRKYHRTVPISAILKYNHLWISH